MMTDCQARDRCPGYGNAEHCHDMCWGYLSMRLMFKQSSIPKRYLGCRSSSLPFQENCPEAYAAVQRFITNIKTLVPEGKGLYLFGETPGTGKTTAACTVGNEYIIAKAFTARQQPQVLYVTTSKLLERLRKAMSSQDEDLPGYLQLIETVPLLIFDDIGAEKPSEWVRERFYNIVNDRNNEMLSTVFTSNLTLDELEVRLGSRIRSRIEGMAIPVGFESAKDMRRRG